MPVSCTFPTFEAPSRRKLRVDEELEQSPSPQHIELVHDNGVRAGARSSDSGVDLANPCRPDLDRIQKLAAAAERKSFVVKVLRDMGDAYEMRSVRAGANKQDKWRKKTYDNCADAVEWYANIQFNLWNIRMEIDDVIFLFFSFLRLFSLHHLTG